jgi:hypothetical protein
MKDDNGREFYAIPVSTGILSPKHAQLLDEVMFEFLWFIDKVTSEKDGVGIVLYGKAVTYQEIGQCLGRPERTVRAHCRQLVAAGYIRTKPTRNGIQAWVMKSKKFGSRKPADVTKTAVTRVAEFRHPQGSRVSENGQDGGRIQTPYKEYITNNIKTPTHLNTDPRFDPIEKHYRKRTQDETAVRAQFDGPDREALSRLLNDQPDKNQEDICKWLDNAFDSTEQIPLKRGFRMVEFCRHYGKYTRGTLSRTNGHGLQATDQERELDLPKIKFREDGEPYHA